MKTVLITGAAGGMGSAICERLLKEGWQIFALDLHPILDQRIKSVVCDLTDLASVEEAKKEFEKNFHHLDAIVHAAGLYDLDAFSEIEEQRLMRIFQLNVFGAYRVNQLFLPYMKTGGRIINTGFEGKNGSRWDIYKPGIVGKTMNIRFGTQWASDKNSNTIEVTFKPVMHFSIDEPNNWNGWTPIAFDSTVNF